MICTTIYLLCVCSIVVSVESSQVQTTLGPVKGKFVNDKTTGASYYSFTGIPYAKPPLGELRFKSPVIKEPWTTVFDATKPGRVCPQLEYYYSRKEMSEDCLIFNIYTPANTMGKLLPVLFTIHGGDFVFLSGNTEPLYGPPLFIKNEVIVVTINYRLGAFGFLSLCSEEVPGNAGIKDMLLALKIVHENIERFGGDPNKITLFGSSAGAAAVELLMLTTKSAGLFHNVILDSGSILNAKFMQLNPRKNAIALGKELGLDLSNDECIIEGLRKVDAFKIVKAQEAIARRDPQRGFRNFRPFTPTVEVECADAIITRPPLELMREGAIQDVPIMMGFSKCEGLEIFPLLRMEPGLIDKLNKNFELLIPEDIQYPYGSVERKNVAARIMQFYFNDEKISFVNVQKYINLISDAFFTYAIQLFIELFKLTKKSSVYYYVFASDTELNWFKAYNNITYPCAAHFDANGYIFLTSIAKPLYECLDPGTRHIQDTILLNLQRYIYYGVPTPNENTNCWPEVDENGDHVEQVYNTIANYEAPIPDRIEFWRNIYNEYFASKSFTYDYFCANDQVPVIN